MVDDSIWLNVYHSDKQDITCSLQDRAQFGSLRNGYLQNEQPSGKKTVVMNEHYCYFKTSYDQQRDTLVIS